MKIVNLLIMLLLFTSCAQLGSMNILGNRAKPSFKRLSKVKEGMNEQQVRAILGREFNIVNERDDKYEIVYEYIVNSNRNYDCNLLSVSFKNGQVDNKAIVDINKSQRCENLRYQLHTRSKRQNINLSYVALSVATMFQSHQEDLLYETQQRNIANEKQIVENNIKRSPFCVMDNDGTKNQGPTSCYSTLSLCKKNLYKYKPYKGHMGSCYRQ